MVSSPKIFDAGDWPMAHGQLGLLMGTFQGKKHRSRMLSLSNSVYSVYWMCCILHACARGARHFGIIVSEHV